ncbi:hypothetical protein FJT64_019191 [Amphibalanus amphitrite]|uniref:Uncharacterized protein n=1 Tax=Amphibalanus amphitrite TaxID=1232801 RepID=A0A6A4X616_AMPAM|nr:hypothetical protein FJT64_019191 [Amphibalanus amphitrite]
MKSPGRPATRLCGANISHSFSRTLKGKGIEGAANMSYMWLFAKMQQVSSIPGLGECFGKLCILAMSTECMVHLDLSDLNSAATGSDDDAEAHISHSFSRTLKGKGIEAAANMSYMWLFAKMQQVSSIPGLGECFGKLCILAMSTECMVHVDLSDLNSAATGSDDDADG